MNCFDVCVARKVALVESQDSFDAMHVHGGNQARVVNLNARDVVRNKQSPPFLMDRQAVGKQLQITFNESRTAIGFLRS